MSEGAGAPPTSFSGGEAGRHLPRLTLLALALGTFLTLELRSAARVGPDAFRFFEVQAGGQIPSSPVEALDRLVVMATLTLGVMLACIGGLIALLRLPGRARAGTSPEPATARPWLIGFGATFTAVLAVTVLVNPRGYYPLRLLRPRIEILRPFRADAYAALPRRPDLVVLGSSRAFTLSPAYVESVTGLRAANLSVEEGSIEDFVVQARFMRAHHDGHLPRVILADVTPPTSDAYSGASRVAALSPIRLLPYMSAETRGQAVRLQGRSLVDGRHFAEALYVLLHLEEHRLQGGTLRFPRWVFDASGEARHRPSNYQADLDHFIRNRATPACETLGPWFRENVKTLADLARADGASVVFYMGPRHPAFYDAKWRRSERFQRCYAAFTAFLREQSQREEIFFLDLLHLDSFQGSAALGDGFYDDHHPGPRNARLLIDAAAPTLRRAFAMARPTE